MIRQIYFNQAAPFSKSFLQEDNYITFTQYLAQEAYIQEKIDYTAHNTIISFIWEIVNEFLLNVYVGVIKVP